MRDPRGIDPTVGRMEHLARLDLIDGERRRPAVEMGDIAQQPACIGMVGVTVEDRP